MSCPDQDRTERARTARSPLGRAREGGLATDVDSGPEPPGRRPDGPSYRLRFGRRIPPRGFRWARARRPAPSSERWRAAHGHDSRGYRMRRLLALGDCVAVLAGIGTAIGLDHLTDFRTASADELILAPVAALLWVLLAGLTGMYHVDERRIDCSPADELGGVVQVAAIWTWLLFLIDTVNAPGVTPVTPAIVLWLLSVPLILTSRSLVRGFAQRRPWYTQTAFVVGTNGDTERVSRMLARHPEYGIDVVRKLEPSAASEAARVKHLIALARQANVDRVVFASAYEGLDERTGALRFLAEQGVKVDLVPGDSEVFRSDAELHFVEGIPFLTLPTTGRPRSAQFIKRAIDVTAAAVGLALMAPLFAYCALRIKLDSPGAVLFRQPRIGRKERPFEVLKFRTMAMDADERKHEVAELNQRMDGMFKIADDPRITSFGQQLRRYSMDELPQLINVLRGEMSLVGPRPLIEAESDLVADHYRARFDVRPGITGPWQVMGRSHIPFHDMLKLDYTYVTNWSIGDDVKLLVRTLNAMSAGRGAY